MQKYDNIRINLVFLSVLLIAGLIGYRLFILSYIKHSLYSKTAEAQRENVSNVLARGNIYLQPDLFLASTNKKFALVYVVPSQVDNQQNNNVAEQLSTILGIDQKIILDTLNIESSSMKVLARQVSNEQVDKVKNLKIKGVGISYVMDRFYPGKELAANIIGFLGYNGDQRSGQYGIESYYDQDLFGKTWQANDYLNPANLANSFNFLKKFISRSDEKEEVVET